MELGSFVLAWAPVPLVLAMAGYLMVAVGGKQYQLSARVVYGILIGMVGIAFINLLILFLSDKFQYSYVATYSSRDLSNSFPHFFKLSALWAGQQGTFLLWLIFGLLLGLWVRSRAAENEGWVMFFYIMAQAFLLVLALISKPFAKLDFIPADGQGLNPLLQNYWMQIHPPIVFMGFAAACIPFSFAMAALATNKYDNWVKQTMPWAVFSVVTLGLGIFLGGYWAYETLGWGGYWAWDPVENASAIPWMTGIALVHGMVVERARGSWRRMNLFLAITMFLLIVYGTFLTRSGVLANFSVHSFVDLGYNNVLWASIVVLAIIAYGLWGFRAKNIKGATPSTAFLSQEFTTFMAVALLLPFILLVLFWTSFPLITTIFSKIPLLSKLTPAPAAIDTSYYNMAGLIFATIFALILGFNSLLFWRKTETDIFVRKLILPVIVALAGSIIFVMVGFQQIVAVWSAPSPPGVSFKVVMMIMLYTLFFFAALFAMVTNILYIAKHKNGSWRTIGGYLSHIGFGLLLLGVVFSSSYGSKTKLTIPEGQSKSALGYDIKFTGTEKNTAKEELAYFEVAQGGSSFRAYSTSKEMRRGNDVQYVRTPYVKKYIFSDLYLSLENMVDNSEIDMRPFQLKLGESTEIEGNKITFASFDSEDSKQKLAKVRPQLFDIGKGESFSIGGQKVTFEKFEMGQHEQGMASKIGAVLHVEYNGKTTDIIPTYEPLATGEHRSDPVDMPAGGVIALSGIRADIGSVSLSYSSLKEMPQVKLGTVLDIVSNSESKRITPVYDPTQAHAQESIASLPDGSQLFLIDVNPESDSASFVLVPQTMPKLATIELSTKPMINLVWVGFLTIVIGAAMAFYRRLKESRQQD